MPSLILKNNMEIKLPTLGTRVLFSDLSQKTVTVCVRSALRKIFGSVHVSCSAKYENAQYVGTFKIDNIEQNYAVLPD